MIVCHVICFHRFFFLFLLYSGLACLFAAGSLVPDVSVTFHTMVDPKSPSMGYCSRHSVQVLVVFLITATLGLILFPFALTQLHHLAVNVTYLETLGARGFSWHLRQPILRRFHVGVCQNLRQTLGTNTWAWFLPIRPRLSVTGYSWPSNVDVEQGPAAATLSKMP